MVNFATLKWGNGGLDSSVASTLAGLVSEDHGVAISVTVGASFG
jgi:hypothetical protein